MKKEYMLAILATIITSLIPAFIILGVITFLRWTSFGFSINPTGLVIEWGLNGIL